MIILTRLNGVKFTLNESTIETIQENPDTSILLSNGNIYIVAESMKEVVAKCIDFNRKTHQQD